MSKYGWVLLNWIENDAKLTFCEIESQKPMIQIDIWKFGLSEGRSLTSKVYLENIDVIDPSEMEQVPEFEDSCHIVGIVNIG